MSGADRMSCLKVLEDFGYEAVDNVPVGLIGRLLRPDDAEPYDTAVGIDSRTRGFEPARLVEEVRGFRERTPGRFELLFLECDDEVLQRRFSATRRRHPLADQRSVGEALALERALMAPLKAVADTVIDTSDLALPDLRRILEGHFAGEHDGLRISVVSFSYTRGLPRNADLVFDVRFLRNPYYVESLRPLTGRDAAVQEHVRGDPDLEGFVVRLKDFLAPLLPRYQAEGKSYLTVALGCTGGQHRSVFLGELLGEWLGGQGWDVAVRHRDLPAAEAAGDGAGR